MKRKTLFAFSFRTKRLKPFLKMTAAPVSLNQSSKKQLPARWLRLPPLLADAPERKRGSSSFPICFPMTPRTASLSGKTPSCFFFCSKGWPATLRLGEFSPGSGRRSWWRTFAQNMARKKRASIFQKSFLWAMKKSALPFLFQKKSSR